MILRKILRVKNNIICNFVFLQFDTIIRNTQFLYRKKYCKLFYEYDIIFSALKYFLIDSISLFEILIKEMNFLLDAILLAIFM